MLPLLATDYVLAIVLFVAAITARWPLISSGETLLHSDEAIVGLMAQDIAASRHFPIYFYGQRYMGALEAYVIAALSPVIHNPIAALRMGPALFFAALVAVQYLMLTRWFGRKGGLIGAATLLAGSPMFAQWSISARGGYIEILLWGTLLVWAYTEWFMPSATDAVKPTDCNRRASMRLRKFLFGFLLGSGFWLNPSIVLFAAPISLHYLLSWISSRSQRFGFSRLGLATLPTLALAAILFVNSIYSVWVENGRVRQMVLFNLLPKPAAVGVIVAIFAVVAFYIRRVYQNRNGSGVPRDAADATQRSFTVAARIGPFILGALIGAAPAACYVVRTTLGLQPLEPSLPLGLRPIWQAGSTLSFLWHGLPLLFGADARPFLELVTMGRPSPLTNVDLMTGAAAVAANMIVLGAGITCAIVFALAYRKPLGDLLRLRLFIPHSAFRIPNSTTGRPPVALLALCAAVTFALYLLGGCTHDFNTIRYLIPLWAILPGLLAAVFVGRRHRFAARLAPICLLAAWSVGQTVMISQLGKSHPLRNVANALIAHGDDGVVAEPLDAHLLSFLTGERCRTAEFQSFWPRLSPYQSLDPRNGPVTYIVETTARDYTQDWYRAGFPGEAPPETRRFLWPHLQEVIRKDPSRCLSREPLPDGYERILLAR